MESKNIFGVSLISILWWVAVWFLFEEIIILTSGNKRHLKIMICLTIIMLIVIYTQMFPTHIESL
jgi:hypothetical protein